MIRCSGVNLTVQVHPALLSEGQGSLVLQHLEPVVSTEEPNLNNIRGGFSHGHGC